VLMARREEQLQTVANNAVKQGAADVHIVVGDVTSEDDCKMAVDAAIQKYGQCTSTPSSSSQQIYEFLVNFSDHFRLTHLRLQSINL
jgi:short-subunit dehydrogenase